MKKFVVGAIAIVILAVLVLGIGAFVAYRAAQPAIQSARGYFDRSGLVELDKQVENQAPYVGPESGELSQDQLERFGRVQWSTRDALGKRVSEIETQYRHLTTRDAGSRRPTMADLAAAFAELSNVVGDARRAQVNALNREHFSSAEYEWVRTRFYRAAGVTAVNRRLGDLLKMLPSSGGGPSETAEVPQIPVVNVPSRNRELVKPLMRFVDDWLPLAFFGL